VFELLTQAPGETFSLMAQQLMLDIVLNVDEGAVLDMSALKLNANDFAKKVTSDEEYAKVHDMLLAECVKNAPKPEAKEDKKADAAATNDTKESEPKESPKPKEDNKDTAETTPEDKSDATPEADKHTEEKEPLAGNEKEPTLAEISAAAQKDQAPSPDVSEVVKDASLETKHDAPAEAKEESKHEESKASDLIHSLFSKANRGEKHEEKKPETPVPTGDSEEQKVDEMMSIELEKAKQAAAPKAQEEKTP
jgi:hypothetical protein